MSVQETLPTAHRALVQHAHAQPLVVEDVPTPQAVPGSAILCVEAAAVFSYQQDVYNGTRQYPYVTPMVPGTFAIARVAAVGPDATSLQTGQLVFFDSFIRARDDPSVAMLSGLSDGGHTGARKLMAGEWRDSSYAQFVKVPLENCYPLDEIRLCGSLATGGLGYTVNQLVWMGMALVGYGGLRSIQLQAGETVIVAPATGGFGGAATLVAVAMGARVIAMGRNVDSLRRLEGMSGRIRTVRISGDHEAELQALARFGCADAFLDISPPAAKDSTHLQSAILSLRKGGRGQWMYDSATVRDMIKLIEAGILGFGNITVAGKFTLEQWEQAFEVAAKMRLDEVTVMSGWLRETNVQQPEGARV